MGISQHRKRFTDPARNPDAVSARRRPSVTLAAANDSQTPPKRKKARAGGIPGSRFGGKSAKRYSAS